MPPGIAFAAKDKHSEEATDLRVQEMRRLEEKQRAPGPLAFLRAQTATGPRNSRRRIAPIYGHRGAGIPPQGYHQMTSLVKFADSQAAGHQLSTRSLYSNEGLATSQVLSFSVLDGSITLLRWDIWNRVPIERLLSSEL